MSTLFNSQIMDQIHEIKVTDIPALHKDNIREYTASEIFQDLYDFEQIQKILNERFTEIYLVSIHPDQANTYPHPYIQDIANKYKNYAEHRPLNILILKKNTIQSPEVAQKISELKALYGDMVQQDTKEYAMIIGFFGGTTGRTNQFLIDELQKKHPIIKIH